MKIFSLLFSLLLGAAVLLIFLRPWGAFETMWEGSGTHGAAPAHPPPASESTAAVDTTSPKPPETHTKAATPSVAAAPEAPKSAEPKTPLLATEQVEADRSAALESKTHATAPGPPETKRYFQVKVRDAGTLEAGLLPTDMVVIRLEGIKAREADETCKRRAVHLALRRQSSRGAHPFHPLSRRDLHAAARRPDKGFYRALQRDRAGPLHLARAPRLGNPAAQR